MIYLFFSGGLLPLLVREVLAVERKKQEKKGALS